MIDLCLAHLWSNGTTAKSKRAYRPGTMFAARVHDHTELGRLL